MVKSYAEDLWNLRGEAGLSKNNTFMRSFIKRIEIKEKKVVIWYNQPIPSNRKRNKRMGVLSVAIFGGAEGTIDRTFALTFNLLI